MGADGDLGAEAVVPQGGGRTVKDGPWEAGLRARGRLQQPGEPVPGVRVMGGGVGAGGGPKAAR